MTVVQRMESTGVPGKIHMSKAAAEQLSLAGKGGWVTPRENSVSVKGKGEMETFFLKLSARRAESIKDETNVSATSGHLTQPGDDDELIVDGLSGKGERLVDWNVKLFCEILKQIIARRENRDIASSTDPFVLNPQGTPLDEVSEIIALPAYDSAAVRRQSDDVKIPEEVQSQLRDYIRWLATMYRKNSFHSCKFSSFKADHSCPGIQTLLTAHCFVWCHSFS